jgi:L-asparaginase II
VTVILAEVTRAGAVESVHSGTIAVVDTDGRLVASVGDAETFAYFRSSAKPFQAIPVVESGAADAFGFTPAELALCCASHYAEPHHQRQVQAMLAKIGLDDGALRCGIPLPSDQEEAGRIIAGLVPRSPLQCDCSGKHTGMLATCVHLGYPIDSYLDPDHPAQRAIRGIVAEVCRVPEDSLRLGSDGCSVPTFGTSIRAFATAYAALAQPERVPEDAGGRHATSLNRLRSAMVAHPENVSGTGDLVTDLMAVAGGRIAAKTGAEGLICLALPEHGLGIAIRVADGSFRSHAVIVAAVLRQLKSIDPPIISAILERHRPEVRNHNGWHVGDIRAAFELRFA